MPESKDDPRSSRRAFMALTAAIGGGLAACQSGEDVAVADVEGWPQTFPDRAGPARVMKGGVGSGRIWAEGAGAPADTGDRRPAAPPSCGQGTARTAPGVRAADAGDAGAGGVGRATASRDRWPTIPVLHEQGRERHVGYDTANYHPQHPGVAGRGSSRLFLSRSYKARLVPRFFVFRPELFP